MEMSSGEGQEHIQHFSHEHPLILLSASSGKDCKICTKKIRGPSYACGSCQDGDGFYIHRSCGELQREIQHPLHPQHSLTAILLPSHSFYVCNGCGFKITSFFYHCGECNFDLHSGCLYMSPGVKYEGHDQHLLTLVEEVKPETDCKACGYGIEGTFCLRCAECLISFHVHECGPQPNHQLPLTIENDHKHVHHHPLKLISAKPDDDDAEGGNDSNLVCDACKKERNPEHPFYSCVECAYSAHVRCVITEKHSNEEKLKHPGHRHYLHLKDEIGEIITDEVTCGFCDKGIHQGPVYSCSTCKYFLHKSCGDVPLEIQLPIHPAHPLRLLRKSYDNLGWHVCDGCRLKIRSFFFYQCRKCNFDLHLDCVYLSPNVTYEGHEHPLTLVEELYYGIECEACGYDIDGSFCLRCMPCNISFHVQCGPHDHRHQQLPSSILDEKHRPDHPLLLITDASHYHLICDACQQKRNPEHPFYQCAEHDYSAHVRCVITKKLFDKKKLKHPGHKHYLNLNESDDGDDVFCNLCEKTLQGPAYSCATCNFSLHKSCVEETPLQIQYTFHKHQTLYLRHTVRRSWLCSGCFGKCDRFAYRCRECSDPDFDMHIKCTSLRPSIKYEGHKHTLIYFDKLLGKSNCRKCRNSSNDPDASFLRCVSCNYTIHYYCTPLPKYINHWSHHHQLKLMDDLVDFNYDDQICDVCETTGRDPKECAYYCADCFFVAELKCVYPEVLQCLEKEPRDSMMFRVINEGDPDEITLADVYSSFTEEEIKEKDDIKEALASLMEEVWEPLTEESINSGVSISAKYPYSDQTMTKFLNRLYHTLPEETPDFEFLVDMDDKLVDVKVGSYTITRKLVHVLKHLVDKYSDIDAGLNDLSDNCKTLFISRLCGFVQSMQETNVMDVRGYMLYQWWCQAKYMQCAGFQVGFLFDQLKRIACANYGADTENYRKDELYKIRKQIDDISEKMEKLAKEKENLMERTMYLVTGGHQHHQVPSCSEDGIMSDLVQFRMKSAARGLL